MIQPLILPTRLDDPDNDGLVTLTYKGETAEGFVYWPEGYIPPSVWEVAPPDVAGLPISAGNTTYVRSGGSYTRKRFDSTAYLKFKQQETCSNMLFADIEGDGAGPFYRRYKGDLSDAIFERIDWRNAQFNDGGCGAIILGGRLNRLKFRDIYYRANDTTTRAADIFAAICLKGKESWDVGSDFEFTRCDVGGLFMDPSVDYPNMDGFSTEPGYSDARFYQCRASDVSDACFDLKSKATTLDECTGSNGRESFKFWWGMTCGRLVSNSPRFAHIMHMGPAATRIVTVIERLETDNSPTKALVRFENSPSTVILKSADYPPGQLLATCTTGAKGSVLVLPDGTEVRP